MESGDEGHLQVLEAIIVTLVLLGAAYTVVTFREPSTDLSRGRASFEKVSLDVLTVLAGVTDDRGSLLDSGLSDSYHCLQDPAATTPLCTGNQSTNLSYRLSYYLPSGAGYALLLDNGVASHELYRSTLPATEIVSSSFDVVPDWNLTFATTELSCYETGMDVNATLIPIRHEAIVNTSMAWVNASAGGPWNGTRSNAITYAWNETLPAATRPASGDITVNVTNVTGKKATFPGQTKYASCDLGGKGAGIVTALRASTFNVLNAANTTTLGGTASFQADLRPLASASGVTLRSSALQLYDPLPPRPGESDAYAPTTTISLGGGTTPGANWTAPLSSLFGAHPAVLRVTLAVGSTTVEARLVTVLNVSLPSGTVPVEAPYRTVLQVWLPDWR